MATRKKATKKARKKTATKKMPARTASKKKAKTTKKTAVKKKTGKKTAKKAPAKTTKKAGGASLKKGDKVAWSSLNGASAGKVKKKITRKTKIKSHKVDASPSAPQYLVESEKTGKKAAHKASSLRKRK